jgi:hypothetical protein
MKKLIIITLTNILLFVTIPAQAQWINSLTVLPSNLTPTDTITVLANCSFPAGGCSDHTKTLSIAGNSINASALHCLGVLTVICNYTDTFKIPPQPIGNYTFYFQLDAGQGPSPCTPGIVAGPSDSVSFVVSPATGLQIENALSNAVVVPNPSNDFILLIGIDEAHYPLSYELFSVDGKKASKGILIDSHTTIDLRALPLGTWQLMVTSLNGISTPIYIVKN